MKVTIARGYEEEKKRIYNEALEGKQKDFNDIKVIPNDFATITIHIAFGFFFIVSLISLAFGGSINAVLMMLSLLIIFNLTEIWVYRSNKKYYGNYIEKHKSMTMDEYIEWIQNNGYRIQFDDKWMMSEYDYLKKFAKLLDPEIVSIESAVTDSDKLSLFVKKKNNQKESILLGHVAVEYRDFEEDELVWDENGVICLYTNNKDFAKQMRGNE